MGFSENLTKLGLKPYSVRSIVICGVILFTVLCIGIGIGLRIEKNRNFSEDAISLDDIQISGFEFYPGEKNGMTIDFVPSVYSEEYNYTVYANGDESYYDVEGKVTFSNGTCHSTLNTTSGMRYDIVLEIEHNGKSRYITLAEKVWGDGSGQNVEQ